MKTIKKVTIVPVYSSEYLPPRANMIFGEFYIAKHLNGSAHLCLCGCGHPVYLPLTKDGWELKDVNGVISLAPSILQRFNCKSHYIITDNVANFV